MSQLLSAISHNPSASMVILDPADKPRDVGGGCKPPDIRRVCITRPAGQAQNLVTNIQALGMECFLLPTLEIEVFSSRVVRETIEQHVVGEKIDKVIFTSSRAVAPVIPYWNTFFASSDLFAIGSGTASPLQRFNLHPILPQTYNSEGLLALPQLQTIKNQNILIFSGEGGKELLQEVLTERGALVKKIAVYRRICPAPPIDFPPPYSFSLIISTSLESLQNLWKMVGQAYPDYLRDQRLLVISPAMVELAKQLGFEQKPVLADNATDEAILESVRKVLANAR